MIDEREEGAYGSWEEENTTAWGMYGEGLGKGSSYVKLAGPALSKFELLSASAISAQADTSCTGCLRINKHNQ